MTQDRAELVETMAREMLGRVNAPEQETYRVAGDLADIALKAAAEVAEQHRKDWHDRKGLETLGFASKLIRDNILALTSEGAKE
ncbi:MAG: hypothetical protein KF895_03295 [Parvibaculum sp.]|nr:hypothetical protein [Parvibaculum sp.]